MSAYSFDLPGESTLAALRRVTAELAAARTELEQRGRAITEADARIRDLTAEVDRLGLSLIKAGQATGAAMAAAEQAARQRDEALATLGRGGVGQLVAGRVRVGARLHIHCPDLIHEEKSMSTTDPMIEAAVEALWPHLPGDVQDGYTPEDIDPWVAAAAAAALRVMADEIDRGPTFAVPPSVISALVRERADRLTGGGSDG